MIEAAGDAGATAWNVVRALAGVGIQQSVAARRCTDLRRRGLIADTGVTRPGVSGRMLTVWRATGCQS